MKTHFGVVLSLIALMIAGAALNAAGQSWTKITNAPPVNVGAMVLLTDGRVLVHEEPNCSGCSGSYSNWYTYTPNATGSYLDGTWTQVASLPSGYEPLYFGSAVLADGNVIIQGGEYNCPSGSCSGDWQAAGAYYNAAANTWTSTTSPFTHVGDAQGQVLPNGTWMQAECCALAFGDSTYPLYAYFNESTLNYTVKSSSTDGKYDDFDEEGWILLPSGEILTVDAYTNCSSSACTAAGNTGSNSELYNPSTNTWSSAGSTVVQIWDSNCGSGSGSYEVGPGVLMPNGTVFYTGASDCEAGHTAYYTISSGTWTAGPNFPNSDAANDAPASIEINGNVIEMASPYSGTFSTPSNFYEWNGSTLTSIANPTNAPNDASYDGHLLVLPTGQIMFTDYSKIVELWTSSGTYESAWQPTVTSVSSTLAPGSTNNMISGTQFNGVTDGAAYGDDFQDNTNYPLVRIVNNSTGDVVYCKTHNHSTMGVATGSATVSTEFDIPSTIGTGASMLYVVANGIPSAGTAVTIGSASFSLSASPSSVSVAQGSSGTSTITSTVSGGFDSAVSLSASGQPTGVTVTFSPTSITGTGTSTMTMAVASTTATGTYTITVTGTGGGLTKTTTVTLTVTTAASFSLSASPTSVSVAQGSSGTSTITSTVSGGFDSAVSLSASGQPTGVTVSFSPTSITGTGTSTMTMAVASTTTVGTYTITVTGTGGGLTKTTTVSLTVTSPLISTTTTVTASPNPSTGGATITFTGTVRAASGKTPTGTVTFKENGTAMGSANLNSSGVATLNYSSLPAGSYTITATYNGSSTDAASTSSSLTETVDLEPTTSTLTTSPNPSTAGEAVTLTCKVADTNSTTPVGDVAFYIGSTELKEVAETTGTATYSYAFSKAGSYAMSCRFGATTRWGASTSATVTQTVDAASVSKR